MSKPINTQFRLNKASLQAKGLVGWWPTLGSAGASSLRDYSGYKNDGVVTGAIAASGEKGRVLLYSEDYVTISDASQYDETSNLTLTAWFRANSWGLTSTIFKKGGHFILRADSNGAYWSSIWWDGDETYWDDGNVTLPSTNVWHHVVLVIENNAISALYVDGVATSISPVYWFDDARDLTNDLIIGNDDGGGSIEDFLGDIGDTRFYNRALSAGEILHQYQNPWELYAPLIPIFHIVMPGVAAVDVSNPPRIQPMRIWQGVR